MIIYSVIFIVLFVSYIGLGVFVLFYLRSEQTFTSLTPSVSVIVACKNEAPHLPATLDSLMQLDYPRDKLQIILINDDSRDNTKKIISSFTEKHDHVKAIHLAPQDKVKPGKAGALQAGIAQSQGEFLFITDADCIVPSQWIKSLLPMFSNDVGITGGFTLLDNYSLSRFGQIQSCDWLYLSSVAMATAKAGKPTSWFGNNIAIRRQTYLDVGGYEALDASLVEDFSLIKAVDQQTSWRIRFTASEESTVSSHPAEPLGHYYNQRKRWARGITQVRMLGLWIMMTAFLIHLFIVLSFIWLNPLIPFAALFVLSAMDFLILRKAAHITGRRDLLRAFPLFEIYYIIYSILLPFFVAVDRKITWKDDNYFG